MTKTASTAAAFLMIVTLAASVHAGSVLYVDDDASPDGDGRSWDTAYRFLQDALVTASSGSIAEIHVAQGIYNPDSDDANPDGTGNREATFQLLNGITLMGGYAGIGANDPDERDIEFPGIVHPRRAHESRDLRIAWRRHGFAIGRAPCGALV